MKKIIILLTFTCCALIILTNCNKPLTATTGGDKTPMFKGIAEMDYSEWEIGKPGGSITISHEIDPKTFNIITSEETSTSDIVFRLYDFIVDYNVLTLEWEPKLVESWEISEDGLTATFKVRRDLKWSDGTPITADDFVWSIETVYKNEKIEGSWMDAIRVGEGYCVYEKVDDNTFKIVTPTLYADILNLANIPIVPKHILEPIINQKGIEALNSHWGVDTDVTTVVGNGPFTLSEYVPNQRIILTKNPYYWRKDAKGRNLPYLDKVNIVIVEDRNTSFLKLMAGELDTIEEVRGEDVASILEKKEELKLELYNAGPEVSTNFLTFNQNYNTVPEPKRSWFNNQKFRQAMSHLIDRQTIIDNIYFGFAFPQYSFVPKDSPLYWEGADDAAYKFDPEAAKKVLDEIGMKDRNGDGIREDESGNDVSFIMQTNSDNTVRVKIGEIIAQEMKKAGINVTFKPADFNVLVTALVQTYEWDAIVIGLTGSLQPFLSANNTLPSGGSLHMIEPGQESPRRDWEKEVDRLYIENTTTTDIEKRKATGNELQRIWITKLPWIYTVNEAAIYVFSTKYGNIKLRGIEYFDSWKGIIEFVYVK